MDERPLYQGTSEASLENGNTGLWYDKFCNSWGSMSKAAVKKAAVKIDKDTWISGVTGCCGNRDELKRQSDRRRKMIECLNGRCIDLQTVGPFVTGLGRDHPVENGFLWHHTLSVPYLPGSSVKGMVGAWSKHWQETDEASWRPILGCERRVGDVVFFDALPMEPVMLEADVMTPHYGEGRPPGDWIDPIPIPFLAVREGAKFRFAVVPRPGSADAAARCEMACQWLKEALEWIGAGAKTAVGYGRFGRFDEARPAPLRRLQKGEAIEAMLYRDDKDRWCGRTEDGQSGTIFGKAPDDAVANETRTLYVRVPPRHLEFQWDRPRPETRSGRRSVRDAPRSSRRR